MLTMRKITSIFLSLIVVTAMLHFSVATHYCSGQLASTRISFSGKLATCGMEDGEITHPFTGDRMGSHCCDNTIRFFSFNEKYFPVNTFVPGTYKYLLQVFFVPATVPVSGIAKVKLIYTSTGPPYVPASTDVDLSSICILRI